MSNAESKPSDDSVPNKPPETPTVTGLTMDGGKFVPTSQPFTRNGGPVRRFLKDMIAVGVYRHPLNGWTLNVTPERMDRWVGAFHEMRKNGVDVEVVVDHRLDADATRGYVVEMFRWGEKLYGVHELIGEEAMELAARVKNVSVLIEKDFLDGKGRRYGEAITHSSIVQKPIVPGQESFVPIAASKVPGAKEGMQPLPILSLTQRSDGSDSNDPSGGTTGPRGAVTSPEQIEQLRKILGAGPELKADNALSLIEERIGQLRRDKEDIEKKATELADELESLKSNSDADRIAASHVDPELLDELAEGAEDRIDALLERGRITPVVGTGLKDLLVGAPGSRNAYALSRRVTGTRESLIRSLLGVLEQNDPVQFGERTRGQYVALGRVTPGEHPPVCNVQTTREMIDMAAGTKRE